jgi:hypothetical protein
LPAHVVLRDGAHFATDGELCYPAPPPGETHDGFYIRLQIGGGYVTARQGDTTYSGGAVAFGLAIGAILIPDLALFGTFTFHEAVDPTARPVNALGAANLGSDSLGAGLAYYIEPVNVYVAAAVLGTSAQLQDFQGKQVASSNLGLGFQAMAGKEWWIGREWGVGVAGEVTGAWMTDQDDSATHWNSFTYSLLFSATYN